MVCIHCGEETQVINSRPQKRLNQVWRRRKCLSCKAIFTTEEVAQYEASWAVRGADGALQAFNRDKLLLSLYKSCEHRQTALEDARALTNTIINKLRSQAKDGVIGRSTIVQVSQVALNRFDVVASVHYQAFHAA
ncbi:MAG: hypothetical protein AAB971_04490 [Patescibacteria group bacterium]